MLLLRLSRFGCASSPLPSRRPQRFAAAPKCQRVHRHKMRGGDARACYAKSPSVLFHAVAIGAAPSGPVLGVIVGTKQSKVRARIVGIDPIGVIKNQAQW